MPPCESGTVFSIEAMQCVPVVHPWNDCPDSLNIVGQKVNQSMIDYIGDFLGVEYKVVENHPHGKPVYEVELILSNNGPVTIVSRGWQIYFCHIMKINPLNLDTQYGIIFDHIQGCLFSISTTPNFSPIFPGQSKKINFWAMNWSVSKTDVMPNWYIYASGLKSRVIASTAGEGLDFVKPFLNAKQYKRTGPSDRFHPFSPMERYGKYNVENLGKAPFLVLPTPKSSIGSSSKLSIKPQEWVIVADSKVGAEAEILSEKLHIRKIDMAPQKKFIFLKVDNLKLNGVSNSEDYEIEMSAFGETIIVQGASPAGVFYGVQSLLSMIQGDSNSGYTIPVTFINDGPRYQYRGVQIDVARNFHPKSDILKLLEVMSMYKLNKLHMHLTDDEGWRLEIPGLPELTSVGSKRCDDLSEETCLLSQLGSGPNASAPVNGFYSVNDYKEILRFAKSRHIEVIPEFDMPGHARAAIKSMEVRAKKNKDPTGQLYLLTDPKDKSVYESVQMFSDNAANPCMQSTSLFVAHVLSEVMDMHKNIQPLRTYHFGGDEVGNGAWVDSPACKKLMNGDVTSTSEVKKHFVKLVSNMTASQSLNLGAWEDGMMGDQEIPFNRTELPNSDIIVYAWDNVWEWDRSSRAYRFANNGFKVVMSQATHLYFDHPYEPDPEERGYYWAPRYIDTMKTFSFKPDNLYANIDTNRSGKKLTLEEVCGPQGTKCVQLKNKENIIGMQGHLWSETVRTSEQMFEMYFPRLIAVAERAWHKAKFETAGKDSADSLLKNDWTKFANTIGYKELLRLDKIGVTYRVPPPGAYRNKKNKLSVVSAFPGLSIEISFDDQLTWTTVSSATTAYKGQTIHLRTRSADLKRTSRVIKMIVK